METGKSDMETVLEKLDLKQYYPEMLSRNDLYQITPESLNPDKSKCSATWQFIYNITRYNYQARNIKSNANESANIGYRERMKRSRENKTPCDHPLDIISTIYLCCDPIARQDLAMHMWGCKFAVPFILQPDKSKTPSVFLWPLRSLIGQFDDENGLLEMPLISKDMQSIAMVRIGSNARFSKSYLLNCLIGGPEKCHPMFFHRNSEGSKPKRSPISEGLVEIGWYMTSDLNSNRFPGPRFFLNLRGDAAHLEAQRKIIGSLATITIVLSTIKDIEITKDTIADLLQNGSRVILFLSDPDPDEDIISAFIDDNFADIPDNQFDIVTVENHMLSEILDILYGNINRLETASDRRDCMEKLLKPLSRETCNVDEDDECYELAFKITNDLISSVHKGTDADRKLKLLPLQEIFWKEWSKTDRDFYRYDQLDETEREVFGQKNDLEKKLHQIRKNQFEHFVKNDFSEPVKHFVTAMSKLEGKSRKLFLRQTKLQLDNLSRKHLRPIYEKYQQLLNKVVEASEEDRIKINDELNALDTLTSKLSFGLEHIMREMGQVYEACASQRELTTSFAEMQETNISYRQLPKLACAVLSEGYSIEILDGEACSVPLRWIKTVLSGLSSVLKPSEKGADGEICEVKVNVISILGIQSSGKSTFLNTVFGMQFAVSAGRCTRGAFLQLVKVNAKMKRSIEADYILVIDTEGLKAAELLSGDSHKHDHELSTFVIGLADTTVINMMGENATYLHENLPVAVHAFLRMNMVGLNPRCIIVHHNVDKRNKEKLLQQNRMLESVLDKHTQKACEIERIPNKLFREIIEFSISRNTYYIPALLEGEQPMAPVSIGYSKESDEMRAKLVGYAETDSYAYTLAYFATRLENLWCAIKTDRFVYEFRTTLEAEAKLELDKGLTNILLGFYKRLDEIIKTLLPHVISKELKRDAVKMQFQSLIAPVEESCIKELNNFIDKRRKIDFFDKWKQQLVENLKLEITNSCEKAVDTIKECYIEFEAIPDEKINGFIQKLLHITHETNTNSLECFEKEWISWCMSLNLLKRAEHVLSDATSVLKQVFPSYKHQITESMVQQSSHHQFKPSRDKHLNHKFHSFSQAKISDLHSTLDRITSLVQNKYREELAEVHQEHIPYINTIPKTIILNVVRYLRDELSKVDVDMEISQMFEIELLVSIAGSIVHNFQGKLQPDFYLQEVKSHMRQIFCQREIRRNTEIALNTIFDITSTVNIRHIRGAIPLLFQDALNSSQWQKRLLNKRVLIGFCLVDMIATRNTTLMKEYVKSPKDGIFSYLQHLLHIVVEDRLFVRPLEEHVRSNMKQLLKPLRDLRKGELTLSDIMDILLQNKKLDRPMELVLKYKSAHFMQKLVDIFTIKTQLREFEETWIKDITKKATEIIVEKDMLENSITESAEIICKRLIGCTELCPLCKEICIHTERHPGKHECIIHRPVWCKNFISGIPNFETCTDHSALMNIFSHNDRDVKVRDMNLVYQGWKCVSRYFRRSSRIWQWIYANESAIIAEITDVDIPSEIPIEWKHKEEKVLKTIKELFGITSVYNFKL